MSISPSELYPLDDKQLMERLGGAQSGSPLDHAVQMEFQRRAFVATAEAAKQSEAASKAALDAAVAAKDTARWTKVSAISIALSVVVMAVSAAFTAFEMAGGVL